MEPKFITKKISSLSILVIALDKKNAELYAPVWSSIIFLNSIFQHPVECHIEQSIYIRVRQWRQYHTLLEGITSKGQITDCRGNKTMR
jgi:hypothetical protein